MLTRLLLALMYRSYFMKGLGSKYRIHAEVSFVCYIFEVLSLLMLSFAPSREDFKLHKNSFAVFLVVSALYMLLTFWLLHFKWLKPRRPWEETGTVNQNWGFNSEIVGENQDLSYILYTVATVSWSADSKGQDISKAIFHEAPLPKNWSNFFEGFLP